MERVRLAAAEYHELTLPGAAMPVDVAELHRDEAGARTMAVRFPPGWSRPGTWRCEAAEDFVVLEGSVRVGDAIVAAASWSHIAAMEPRPASSTPEGALAIARFDRSPRWHEESD